MDEVAVMQVLTTPHPKPTAMSEPAFGAAAPATAQVHTPAAAHAHSAATPPAATPPATTPPATTPTNNPTPNPPKKVILRPYPAGVFPIGVRCGKNAPAENDDPNEAPNDDPNDAPTKNAGS